MYFFYCIIVFLIFGFNHNQKARIFKFFQILKGMDILPMKRKIGDEELSPLKKKLKETRQFIDKATIPVIPPPSGECKLLIEGKEYFFPILHGNDGGKFLDLRTLYNQSGHLIFDPGFMATGLCCSSITLTDGDKGQLKYRGYSIEDLSANCCYLEVCYLLMYGELPPKGELERFNSIVYAQY